MVNEAQDARPTVKPRITYDFILKLLPCGRTVSLNQNFDKCMTMLLEHEGGYVNHSKDPGGMTNLGITKRVCDKLSGSLIP